MNDLSINSELVRRILSGFIRSETNRAGYSKIVVGVSGTPISLASWRTCVL